MAVRLLVVDDEKMFLRSVRRALFLSGYENVTLLEDPRQVQQELNTDTPYDIALIDISMPYMDGLEVLNLIKSTEPSTECIMISAMDDAKTAVRSLKFGAYDYLVKPFSSDDLIKSVQHALEKKQLLELVEISRDQPGVRPKHPTAFSTLVSDSSRVISLLREAELHADSDVPVLITGESGTGKELLAQSIHNASPRCDRPFTPINMASLNASLFESVFFGYKKGAFTGADADRCGFMEMSDGGTIFLDEIGNMPLEMQAKLLRLLQGGEYIRLGDTRPCNADIRFVAATNENLETMMAQGRFRKDLYYRLRGAWLHLPPLRERMEDLPCLVERFLKELDGKAPYTIDPEALETLKRYTFPGNVRELKALIQSAANLAENGRITRKTLPRYITAPSPGADGAPPAEDPVLPIETVIKNQVLLVYESFGRNKAQAAKALGISVNTLRSRLKSYGES